MLFRSLVHKKKLRSGEAMASQQQSTGQEPGALTGSPSGWKRLGTRLFALTDQAYSTPFIGIRLLMWVLVLGWGLVWIARSCEVNSPLTWFIFATTVVGALAHGRVVLRRERPSFALQWGTWKWFAIDAAGLAIITFVYAAPLKYLVPGSQCGPGVSSATIDPMSGFIAGFFGAFLIWGLAAILGKANQERKREAGQ